MTLRLVFLWLILISYAVGAPKILILGDSLSAGYGLDMNETWVSIIAENPKEFIGFDAKILNASMSGETTSGGLSRLPGILNRHDPDVVLILLGANDGLRGLPLAEMADNLFAMIQLIHNSNATVLYGGIEIQTNSGGPYTRAFRKIQDQVASEAKIAYLPFFLKPIALRRELFQVDGLHPTSDAQHILADYIGQFIRVALSSK